MPTAGFALKSRTPLRGPKGQFSWSAYGADLHHKKTSLDSWRLRKRVAFRPEREHASVESVVMTLVGHVERCATKTTWTAAAVGKERAAEAAAVRKVRAKEVAGAERGPKLRESRPIPRGCWRTLWRSTAKERVRRVHALRRPHRRRVHAPMGTSRAAGFDRCRRDAHDARAPTRRLRQVRAAGLAGAMLDETRPALQALAAARAEMADGANEWAALTADAAFWCFAAA